MFIHRTLLCIFYYYFYYIILISSKSSRIVFVQMWFSIYILCDFWALKVQFEPFLIHKIALKMSIVIISKMWCCSM